MVKKYQIDISGFSESDCNEITRFLTREQYELIDGIFSDLVSGVGYGDYAPFVSIEEIKLYVSQKKETEKGTMIWCEHSEHLYVGQKITYEGVTFKIEELGEIQNTYSHPYERSVLLSPNKKVDKLILWGSKLEVEYNEKKI